MRSWNLFQLNTSNAVIFVASETRRAVYSRVGVSRRTMGLVRAGERSGEGGV